MDNDAVEEPAELPQEEISSQIQEEAGWSLVWHDEFEESGLEDRWNLQDWPSDKNKELQYYSPDNLTVRDGNLVIESKKERFKGKNYTSGAITTEDLYEFTYGKVEIRAKIPKGKGIFPALWLVNSTNKNWLPEIDIMENIGQNPNEIYYVVHWNDQQGNKQRDYYKYVSDIELSKDFHTYGLIWEKDKLVWTLDGEEIFETNEFSPDTPLFLYINTAVGGNWPGSPDPDDEFPKEFLIDYVRVYQVNTKEG
ncbi:glycoside hydrolase family 16 protein [Rossellomorea sp. AcN35-11]|nr:glycoside hydrolase family 16 protein [Rossellomorea aquimaris]WJV30889.1 glycoside hydrolase family 16 protein [Rossellomorea sp. AcN35-11]